MPSSGVIRRPIELSPAADVADLVVVDHSVAVVELLSDRLEREAHSVVGFSDPREAMAMAAARASDPPEIVVVDLTFPRMELNGLDVMVSFNRKCPESSIIIYTSGDGESGTMLRIAWQSLHPASAVSKLSPVSTLVDAIESVARTGQAEVDPLLKPLIPTERSPWLAADGYRRLVPHAGHAKLWDSLLRHESPPSYKAIGQQTNLSVNTIRNYRDDLLGELRLHGLDNPTMQQMHEFAHSVRPLLSPFLVERLGGCEPNR